MIREACNIVGGSLKSALSDLGLSSEISVPSITTGNNFAIEILNMDRYERFVFRCMEYDIIRGIERRNIFRDDKDRDNFIDRLSDLLPATQTACYAWTFIPNHAHFLFRSSGEISTLMRRSKFN